MSSVHFQISIPILHKGQATPNNNIAITSNHTVLLQPPQEKALDSGIDLFLYLKADGQKSTFLAHIYLAVFEEKKKKSCHTFHIWFALTELCSRLLCGSEAFWRIAAWRMVACAGMCRQMFRSWQREKWSWSEKERA